ncbi:MAG: hypothetical protein GTO40_23695 [Deltaproteobacteria bacterium]|nr:hypothetical protein [Deltaproteobacteria bacterium]
MECAKQGCHKEPLVGSNYCKDHYELDKANVDKEEHDDDGGAGEGGGE